METMKAIDEGDPIAHFSIRNMEENWRLESYLSSFKIE